jgi:hypothetical protein
MTQAKNREIVQIILPGHVKRHKYNNIIVSIIVASSNINTGFFAAAAGSERQ